MLKKVSALRIGELVEVEMNGVAEKSTGVLTDLIDAVSKGSDNKSVRAKKLIWRVVSGPYKNYHGQQVLLPDQEVITLQPVRRV